MPKSKYDTHVKPYFDKIANMKKKGFTDKEVAEFLNVGYSNFLKYKANFKELKECMEKNANLAIREVENALYKKAIGYNYEEITQTEVDGEVTEIKKVTKHQTGDFKAQQFILRNRTRYWSNNEQLEKELKELQKEKLKAETDLINKKITGEVLDADLINNNLLSIAEIISNPLKNREIAEIEKNE